MSVTDSFKTFVLEQLNRVVPPVRARRMFGGVGIYSGESFFALIADDMLFFKTDATTQPEFELRGMEPFRPFGDEGGAMHYHQLPEDILENTEQLRIWAEKSITVARTAKRPRTRRGAR